MKCTTHSDDSHFLAVSGLALFLAAEKPSGCNQSNTSDDPAKEEPRRLTRLRRCAPLLPIGLCGHLSSGVGARLGVIGRRLGFGCGWGPTLWAALLRLNIRERRGELQKIVVRTKSVLNVAVLKLKHLT